MVPVVQVAVCGPAKCTAEEGEVARTVGGLLARVKVVVLCGGYGGVMDAAAAGAAEAGGLVVGVLSGGDRAGASRYLSVTIATGMGQARNAVLVRSADAVIAVGGSWGTLSEVALAMRLGIPVVGVGGWRVVDAAGREVTGVLLVDSPEEAVAAAVRAASGKG